jgi:hypothetical protein
MRFIIAPDRSGLESAKTFSFIPMSRPPIMYGVKFDDDTQPIRQIKGTWLIKAQFFVSGAEHTSTLRVSYALRNSVASLLLRNRLFIAKNISSSKPLADSGYSSSSSV